MSLQTRLADLVAAVGADIKADRVRLTALEGAAVAPRCLLYKTAAQTIPNTTFTPLVWEGEDEDLSGMHAPNTSTIVVPTAGIYFASAFIGYSTGSTAGRILTMIYVNGVESRSGFRHEVTAPAIGTASWYTGLPTGLFKLAAGDTLSVVAYHNVGATLMVTSTSDNAKFSVFKVDVKGAKGDKGDPGDASASYTLDTWHTLTLGSGISVYSSDTPQYMKDPFGKVALRGQASMTAGSNVIIGTLPTGYRPSRAWRFAAMNGAGSAVGSVVVNTNGEVVLAASVTGNVIVLDEIEFDSGTVTTFAAGPAGPQGLKGDKGDKGDAGRDGDAVQVEIIDWTAFSLAAGAWTADPNYPPAWMLDSAGMVHLRGRAKVVAASSGLAFSDASPLYQPNVGSGGSAQTMVPGVNQTSDAVGYWEILGTAMLWHGTKATNDFVGLDGVSYPAGGGALGKKVVPTLASGVTSDPTDPLIVYSNGKEIRVLGTIQLSMVGGGAFTDLFTVPSMDPHTHHVVANARGQSVSGAQHPTGLFQLDFDDFTFSNLGLLRARSLYAGTNVMKISFNGLFTTP